VPSTLLCRVDGLASWTAGSAVWLSMISLSLAQPMGLLRLRLTEFPAFFSSAGVKNIHVVERTAMPAW
jgi:hypothetical protein